jgi:hypothetical protein
MHATLETDIARECILDALAEHGQLSLSRLIEVECKGIDRNVVELMVHELQSLGKIRNPFLKWELVPPRRDEATEAEVGDREHGRDTEPAPPLDEHDPTEHASERPECSDDESDREASTAADIEPASCDLPSVPHSERPHPFEVEAEGAEAEASSDPEPTSGSARLLPAEPENSTPKPLRGARVLDDPMCSTPPRTIDDIARRVAEKSHRDVLDDAADLGLRVSFELEQIRRQLAAANEELAARRLTVASAYEAVEKQTEVVNDLAARETKLARVATALAGATG